MNVSVRRDFFSQTCRVFSHLSNVPPHFCPSWILQSFTSLHLHLDIASSRNFPFLQHWDWIYSFSSWNILLIYPHLSTFTQLSFAYICIWTFYKTEQQKQALLTSECTCCLFCSVFNNSEHLVGGAYLSVEWMIVWMAMFIEKWEIGLAT